MTPGHPEYFWPSCDALAGPEGPGTECEVRFLVVALRGCWRVSVPLTPTHPPSGRKVSAHLCPRDLMAPPSSPQTSDPVVTAHGRL